MIPTWALMFNRICSWPSCFVFICMFLSLMRLLSRRVTGGTSCGEWWSPWRCCKCRCEGLRGRSRLFPRFLSALCQNSWLFKLINNLQVRELAGGGYSDTGQMAPTSSMSCNFQWTERERELLVLTAESDHCFHLFSGLGSVNTNNPRSPPLCTSLSGLHRHFRCSSSTQHGSLNIWRAAFIYLWPLSSY